MSLRTLKELRDEGLELGDTIEVVVKFSRKGVLVESGLEPGKAAVRDELIGATWSIRDDEHVELVEAAQPELVPGELYQPIAGNLKSYVYKYRGSGNFVAYVDGTGSLNFMGQSIVRSLGELGRVKRVKLQVVDA